MPNEAGDPRRKALVDPLSLAAKEIEQDIRGRVIRVCEPAARLGVGVSSVSVAPPLAAPVCMRNFTPSPQASGGPDDRTSGLIFALRKSGDPMHLALDLGLGDRPFRGVGAPAVVAQAQAPAEERPDRPEVRRRPCHEPAHNEYQICDYENSRVDFEVPFGVDALDSRLTFPVQIGHLKAPCGVAAAKRGFGAAILLCSRRSSRLEADQLRARIGDGDGVPR